VLLEAPDEPGQLILPPAAPVAPKAKARAMPAPEQVARVYIARRAKPLVVPGHVRAIREGTNLDAVVIAILGMGEGAKERVRPHRLQVVFSQGLYERE
jgi:hypothetical protein